jgi:hypothetical protein
MVLDAEMDTLEGVLQTTEPQAQYKGLSFELGDEIRAISLRYNGLHPLLWQQAFQDHSHGIGA